MEEPTSILIIGKDRTLNALIADSLEEVGYGVRIVQGGWEGLPALSQRGFRVVILAGDRNGPDQLLLCAVVRQVHHLPIVVLGGEGGSYAAFAFLEAGADVYMPGPPRMNELMARMRALLRRRWQDPGGRPAGLGAEIHRGSGSQASSIRQLPNDFRPLPCMPLGHQPVFLLFDLTPCSGGMKWSCQGV